MSSRNINKPAAEEQVDASDASILLQEDGHKKAQTPKTTTTYINSKSVDVSTDTNTEDVSTDLWIII